MRHFAVVFSLLLISFAAFAQTDRGSITGAVTDPAGAGVPGAIVEIANQATGAVYRGGTSGTGNYIVGNLPAGEYTLSAGAPGFKKFVRENLTVQVATDTRADIGLQVGQSSETVTVTESTPLLKTESGELSHAVTAETANSLPVLTIGSTAAFGAVRNPLAVMNLLPGVQFSADSVLRVNGLPSNSQAIRIEGQDATNGIWRQIDSINQPGMEAVQEVAIQTSNYAAEFGQAGGGFFNFTMKSGTNQFHGSAYDYFVNEVFNAGLPYTNAGNADSLKAGEHVRTKQRRNDYGFTIGGPVEIPKVYNGRNRSFFFFNFEQFRETQGVGSFIDTVPTEAYRDGDFSTTVPVCVNLSAACPAVGGATYLTQGAAIAKDPLGRLIPQYGVYDPDTTRQAPNGAFVRDLFPNGTIPANRIDPVALALQKLFPQPTNSGLINNYRVPFYTNYKHTTNPSIKLDDSISPTIKISGYYSAQLTFDPNNNGLDPVLTGVAPTDNRSHTVRVNYDQSLRPTLLLHLGAGYLRTYNPSFPANSFNESGIGLNGYYANLFPGIVGLTPVATGGVSFGLTGIGAGTSTGYRQWDEKPTANANLAWVKNNHNFKFGAEFVEDAVIVNELTRGNGIFTFSPNETSDPWQGTASPALNGTSGFSYASFLLGAVDNLTIAPAAQMKLGNHGIGLFAQDSWKVTRKLTLDYGLRYDFQTYLREQYGRMQDAAFELINAKVGRVGAVQYEGYGPGRCNCDFSHNYPFAFGPRLGLAYQIGPKTVLRAGAALTYGTTSNNSQLSLSVEDFYSFNAPGYGVSVLPDGLAGGNPYAPGNPYGNPVLTWPNFDSSKYPTRTVCAGTASAACYPPQSPSISIDQDARPPRIFQWSIGLQRELSRNLVVEAGYVGNRGAWFTAPGLDVPNYNALNISDLAQFGLNIGNAADRSLLTSLISSPTAIQRGFGVPAYPGLPSSGAAAVSVLQNIRPYPQWTAVLPFLGPPLGDTWYDSLQAKATKRYSHGLSAQGSFTWQKELSLGTNSDSAYQTAGSPAVNDVYNRLDNKQLSPFSRPFQLVFSGTYVTPKPSLGVLKERIVSRVVRDWTLAAVLRYQSGALMEVPSSSNNIFAQLGRSAAFFSGGATYQNFTNGDHNLFLVDPNSHFDPTKQLVLNPAAWTDAPAGTFGVTSAFYNNYRWQRQPSENLSFGRLFRAGKEGKYTVQLRMEFQNIFNRHFFATPISSNPSLPVLTTNPFVAGTPGQTGALSSGFGYVSTLNGGGAVPRTGLLVARFQF